MRLRRCLALLIEPRERRELDLEALLLGQPRLRSEHRWIALAAHLDAEIELDDTQLAVLGELSSEEACERADLEHRFGAAVIARMLGCGLLLDATINPTTGAAGAESRSAVEADASLRKTHWRALAAVAHRHLRWRGINTEDARRTGALDGTSDEILACLGEPPSAGHARAADAEFLPLPTTDPDGLPKSTLRATCRNFDLAQRLPLPALAALLHRVYGAQGHSIISGVPVLKKNSPSAGGLHPVEAYLLVQHVEGVEPGLYHYRPDTHALEPLKALTAIEARERARVFVAHQPWFVDAHVQVILAARFQRNFWKYRNHAKAYRAVILDAGHLSQMQYMVATELGLGAFITAAINEGDIEDAFGLDPMQEGVLAVTGFGYRGERMDVLEFDPLQKVWPEWQPE
jgi:putative peptide maturation dehydrogenase